MVRKKKRRNESGWRDPGRKLPDRSCTARKLGRNKKSGKIKQTLVTSGIRVTQKARLKSSRCSCRASGFSDT